jgi:hypothetical protein
MMPGVNWLSGLRSKKSRPTPSPISIPTRFGRFIRVTRAWETAIPTSTEARPVSIGATRVDEYLKLTGRKRAKFHSPVVATVRVG